MSRFLLADSRDENRHHTPIVSGGAEAVAGSRGVLAGVLPSYRLQNGVWPWPRMIEATCQTTRSRNSAVTAPYRAVERREYSSGSNTAPRMQTFGDRRCGQTAAAFTSVSSLTQVVSRSLSASLGAGRRPITAMTPPSLPRLASYHVTGTVSGISSAVRRMTTAPARHVHVHRYCHPVRYPGSRRPTIRARGEHPRPVAGPVVRDDEVRCGNRHVTGRTLPER